MKNTHGNWQRSIWKLVTNPGIELLATIAVVMVATWYLIDSETVRPDRGAPVVFAPR